MVLVWHLTCLHKMAVTAIDINGICPSSDLGKTKKIYASSYAQLGVGALSIAAYG